MSAGDDPSRPLRSAAMLLAGEAIVRDVVEVLAPTPVMPLKGVLLQKTVYKGAPEVRRLADVDLLVPSVHFAAAHERLSKRGYRPLPGHLERTGCAYESPWRMHLDLHAELYDPFVFRVRSEDLFARASVDEALFGTRVHVPHPEDLYAHLVGHFAKGRLSHRHPNLVDLPLTAAHFALDAVSAARRLEEAGLRRAARYTLGVAVDSLGDEFAARVLRELPPDPVGDLAASLARRVLCSPRTPWLLQVASGHALNESLGRGAVSLAYATGKWLRRRSRMRAARVDAR